MLVRRATGDDLHAVIALAKKMHGESPAYRNYRFEPGKIANLVKLCVESPDWLLLIAYNLGTPVGFVAAGAVEMIFGSEKTVDDLAVYVVPEKRGSMLGPRLVKALVDWAKTTGAREVRLGVTTEIDNSRVTTLLERMGFSQTGTLSTLKL